MPKVSKPKRVALTDVDVNRYEFLLPRQLTYSTHSKLAGLGTIRMQWKSPLNQSPAETIIAAHRTLDGFEMYHWWLKNWQLRVYIYNIFMLALNFPTLE